MAGGTEGPLEAFIDRYVPRDVLGLPGRFTVLRRQAMRELRELMAAERADQRKRDVEWVAARAASESEDRSYALIAAAAALREAEL
jgi:hypothetical protein